MHDIAEFLIAKNPQDVNAWGFSKKETPLHVASRLGHADVAQLLLEHGAYTKARDSLKALHCL
jgi:ankyrin repeat protein